MSVSVMKQAPDHVRYHTGHVYTNTGSMYNIYTCIYTHMSILMNLLNTSQCNVFTLYYKCFHYTATVTYSIYEHQLFGKVK